MKQKNISSDDKKTNADKCIWYLLATIEGEPKLTNQGDPVYDNNTCTTISYGSGFEAFWTFQAILGIVFLFLLLLTTRIRFRIR